LKLSSYTDAPSTFVLLARRLNFISPMPAMTFWKFLREERYKLILGAMTTAAGFFVALLANSAVEDWKEKKVYETLLNVTRAEAKSNQVVLEKSFLPLYADGVVLREFSVATATQNLLNPIFIKHASPQVVQGLGQYVRDLNLANAYRARAEAIRFNDAYLNNERKGKSSRWEAPLIEMWKENLDAARNSIENIATLP